RSQPSRLHPVPRTVVPATAVRAGGRLASPRTRARSLTTRALSKIASPIQTAPASPRNRCESSSWPSSDQPIETIPVPSTTPPEAGGTKWTILPATVGARELPVRTGLVVPPTLDRHAGGDSCRNRILGLARDRDLRGGPVAPVEDAGPALGAVYAGPRKPMAPPWCWRPAIR